MLLIGKYKQETEQSVSFNFKIKMEQNTSEIIYAIDILSQLLKGLSKEEELYGLVSDKIKELLQKL